MQRLSALGDPKTWLLTVYFASLSFVQADPLPQTEPLTWAEEDLSERIMDGAYRYILPKIQAEMQARDAAPWDSKNKRALLQERLGLSKIPHRDTQIESFGTNPNFGVVLNHERFEVRQVRWQVTEFYVAEGLLVEPSHPKTSELWIALPDADETPEQLLGISPGAVSPLPDLLSLAANGTRVLVPTLVHRKEHVTGLPLQVPKPVGQSAREWIHRQAFHMGQHLVGYEVLAIQRAIDAFAKDSPNLKVQLSGFGEGAWVALLAGALDERISTNLISGLLGQRHETSAHPLFRHIQGFERHWGLRGLIRLHESRTVYVHPHPSVDYSDVKGSLFGEVDLPRLEKTLEPKGNHVHVLPQEKVSFKSLGLVAPYSIDAKIRQDSRKNFSPEARQQRLIRGLELEVQQLVRNADFVRDESFLYQAEPELRRQGWSTRRRHAVLNPTRFLQGVETHRKRFETEAMGKFDDPLLSLRPKTRLLHDNEYYLAHEVTIEVFPELHAWAVLLQPRDLKPGESRPMVVLQHGRNGLPSDLIDANKTAYGNSAVELVKRGFIVLVPHNLYRGEEKYRVLDRMANVIDASLFSFILPSHQQLLRWVKTLPQVDASRMAFYGLSYGGESAMRLPPILKEYSAVICSGDFNQWTRKVAATDYPSGFMYSNEWEMPYWNLGNTFDYAEMAYLIFPRPFMVERGHHDLVAPDAWVAHEFAKVHYLYAQFGMADRLKYLGFQGGHAMGNEESFDFLHQHLRWPKPQP